jgi:mevalonate kinase
LACKYCGGGYGGYALYLFKTTEARDTFVNQEDKAMVIEPYLKPLN